MRNTCLFPACIIVSVAMNFNDPWAAVHTAAGPSYADVSAAVAGANAGDTVAVPAGSAAWANTLRGSGFSVTLPSSLHSPELTIIDFAGRTVFRSQLKKENGTLFECSWPGSPANGTFFAIIKEPSRGKGLVIVQTKLIIDR